MSTNFKVKSTYLIRPHRKCVNPTKTQGHGPTMIFVSFGITFCASLLLDKRLYFLKDVHILSNGFQDISGHPKRHLSHFQQVLCRSWLKPHKTAWISVHLLNISKEVAMAGTFQSNCHTKTRYTGVYIYRPVSVMFRIQSFGRFFVMLVSPARFINHMSVFVEEHVDMVWDIHRRQDPLSNKAPLSIRSFSLALIQYNIKT